MESNTVIENRNSSDNSDGSDSDQQNQQSDNSGKTFGEYWKMVKKHWISIVVCTSVGIVAGLGYNYLIKSPKYANQGSVLVMAIDDSASSETSAAAEAANVSLSLSLMSSISDFMEDTPVLTQVMTDINANDHYSFNLDDVKKMVSVSPKTYTSTAKSLYIIVTATSKNTKLSTDLVNLVLNDSVSVANSNNDYSLFKGIIKITSPATIENATDSSTSGVVIMAVATIIGLLVGILYAIIKELTNVFVISKKETEELTGLKVIGMIPDYSNFKKKDKADHDDSNKETK